jgi:DNA mismatch repair ATPase MutS
VKAFLMHRDRDFDLEREPPPGAQDLLQDLELEVLFKAMANGDAFLLETARQAVLGSLTEVPAVLYRQDVLRDCIANAATVRGLYSLIVETIEHEKKNYWGVHSRNPGYLLHRSVEVLSMFVGVLRKLRQLAEAQADRFASEGFTTLFAMLRRELGEDYLATLEAHLVRLKFRRGVLVSARLGKGNMGVGHMLRRPNDDHRPWIRRLFGKAPAYTFHIAERDEGGARAVGELRDRGIAIAANAAAQSNDHILAFFRTLRTELAFYCGCLNLYEKLSAKGEAVGFPVPCPGAERRYTVRGLYDTCLALKLGNRVVGNDVDGDGAALFVVTGANQGGKSTFLRSVGLAQLMMQCGMFVPARSYVANLSAGLFTHHKREEDATMRAGKLEEEIERMSAIVDRLSPGCTVLFNEPFQSTNEREGSEIAHQIVRALLESRIKVFLVTHMYALASSLSDKSVGNTLFLRAERREDGTRTFRIIPGKPLRTSFGKDLYHQIFSPRCVSKPAGRSGESDVDVAASAAADRPRPEA